MLEVRVEPWSPGHAHFRASIVDAADDGVYVVYIIDHPFARAERAYAVAEQELERITTKGGSNESAVP